MDNSLLKKLLPHGIALVVMMVLAFGFFSPYVFDGKVLQQGDNQKAGAAQTELNKFREQTGHEPLWTNAYFSGMPTVQIHQETHGNLTQPIFYGALLGQGLTAPHTNVLLAMLSMYILLLALSIDWRLALIGAIGFGLSSFNMDIIEAGHSTKMVALAYAPLILAGVAYAFRGRYLLGGGVFALGTALQLYANHYQITYYTFLIVLVWGIFELINAIKNGEIAGFSKAVGVLALGMVLGVLSNLSGLWTTNEYQTETQRGVPNLSNSERPKEGGLSKKYIFDWSYGIGESLTLLVQNAYGGGASQTHAETETYQRLSPQVLQGMQGVAPDKARKEADKQISSLFYTGSQPFVGVSIYFGAIFVFLFAMGLALLEGRKKWWIVASTLFMMFIAWGDNSPIAPLLVDIFPLFNKFRAVTQALGLGQLLFIVMATTTLQAVFDPSVSHEKKLRSLYIGAGATALLCLFAMSVGGVGKQDAQLQAQLKDMLLADRASLARADALRSLALVGISAGLMWLAIQGRMKTWIAVAGIGLLTLFDFWSIGKRILPNEEFETKQEANGNWTSPKPADTKVMADKDPDYRVLDLRQGPPFTNAQTAMFHKSVGGYHAAKLMIYQEMIDNYLGNFKKDVPIFAQPNMPLYGMLNAKYLILDDSENGVQLNPFALGNAWFIKSVKVVENADQEMAEVGKINPRYELVVQKKFADIIGSGTPQYDSTNTIKLTSYNPDKLEYESSAKADQIAVFSEVYYPMEKGWNLTIDGQPAKFAKVNYILRAAKIPAGNHKVVMEFHPKSYYTGETVSMVASLCLLLLFAVGLFVYFKNNGIPDTSLLPDELAGADKVQRIRPIATPTPTEVEKPKPTMKKKK